MALFQLHWLEPILQYCTKLANFSLMSGMFPTKAISSAEIMSCPRPSQKCVEEVAIGISFQDEAYDSVLGSKWVLTQAGTSEREKKHFLLFRRTIIYHEETKRIKAVASSLMKIFNMPRRRFVP